MFLIYSLDLLQIDYLSGRFFLKSTFSRDLFRVSTRRRMCLINAGDGGVYMEYIRNIVLDPSPVIGSREVT